MLAGCLAVLLCCSTTRAEDWFVESSAAHNLSARHNSGATGHLYFPEIMCGGAGWLDYDGDGDLDLYLVQAYQLPTGTATDVGNQLFRNEAGRFVEVGKAAGADDRGYGNGVACGDYDGDGDVDIYVNNTGPNVLLRNNGNGTFTDVTQEAGVGDPRWSISSAFVDYDADGDLDLFVANYMNWSLGNRHACFGRGGRRDYCGPHSFYRPVRDTLYRNDGDGTFTDVTEDAGLGGDPANGLGVVTGDFNGDGRVDIYVANDLTPNHLWLNRGAGFFVNDSLMMGCAFNEMGQAEAGMGVCTADYDDDGDLDLYMAHNQAESNTFYEFDDGLFEDVTGELGLAMPSVPFTGFGAGFIDYDNDGRLDLFVGNGRISLRPNPHSGGPLAETNQLYRLTAAGKYEEVSSRAGAAFRLFGATRAAAFADFDNDGDTDIALVNMDGPLRLLENRVGNKNHWIGVSALDQQGRHALGATVTVVTEQGPRNRLVQRAYSYAASNDPRVLVGLGDSTVVRDVVVRWPRGATEHFGPQECDRYIRVIEGRGKSRHRGQRAPHGANRLETAW
jgi:hypothetical protein